MDSGTLAEVLRGAQRGDQVCFDRLVESFASRIFGFLYRVTGSRDDAEDLMQEVFLRVVRMLSTYRHEDRFEAWIFRIAANLARDRIRRAGRTTRRVNAAALGRYEAEPANGAARTLGRADRSEAADAGLVREEEVDALNAALAELPEAEREVIMLRHFAQLSFKEIAELTGTPLGTALARSHRGLARLRERMTEDTTRRSIEDRLA